jgi:hypothetical protein
VVSKPSVSWSCLLLTHAGTLFAVFVSRRMHDVELDLDWI